MFVSRIIWRRMKRCFWPNCPKPICWKCTQSARSYPKRPKRLCCGIMIKNWRRLILKQGIIPLARIWWSGWLKKIWIRLFLCLPNIAWWRISFLGCCKNRLPAKLRRCWKNNRICFAANLWLMYEWLSFNLNAVPCGRRFCFFISLLWRGEAARLLGEFVVFLGERKNVCFCLWRKGKVII